MFAVDDRGFFAEARGAFFESAVKLFVNISNKDAWNKNTEVLSELFAWQYLTFAQEIARGLLELPLFVAQSKIHRRLLSPPRRVPLNRLPPNPPPNPPPKEVSNEL